MTLGTSEQTHKRSRNSTDYENDEKNVKKVATRESIFKNAIISKFSNFIDGSTYSSRSKAISDLKKFEEKKKIFALQRKVRVGGKGKIFFSDFNKKDEEPNLVKKIVENPDNLSSRLFSTETGKVRNCKHCNHVAMTQSDYWEHLKIHIEENVRWSCPLCKFITAHKYHLMQHFREHVGSLPAKTLKFVHSFWDKSKLCTQIISLTEQLKLRNIEKRTDFHTSRTLNLECESL